MTTAASAATHRRRRSVPPVVIMDDAPAQPDGPEDVVRRALDVPTRAGIYRHLQVEAAPLSAKDVAERFGLHPNVARNHLDVLAEAGLAITGRRKQPAGGRPARVYVAREQVGQERRDVPPGAQLGVHVVVQLIAGLAEHEAKLELLAEDQGRRLVGAKAGRASARTFQAAGVVAVEALRAAFPEIRLSEEDDDLLVDGLEIGLRLIGEVDAGVGDALARGFLRGALAAAGAPAIVTSTGGRVRARLDEAGLGALPTPDHTIQVRNKTHQQAVEAARAALRDLPPGGWLEVLTDLEGAPAAFARWVDRAGHEIADVRRIRDNRARPTVRIVLRKATGRA
ncbi:MAG: helix-turn-helix domain-containing protein [Nitriliruptorales bacterium]|nr:helix-turn-helix domain-containing protein [Nitriliruptorales bacterium]